MATTTSGVRRSPRKRKQGTSSASSATAKSAEDSDPKQGKGVRAPTTSDGNDATVPDVMDAAHGSDDEESTTKKAPKQGGKKKGKEAKKGGGARKRKSAPSAAKSSSPSVSSKQRRVVSPDDGTPKVARHGAGASAVDDNDDDDGTDDDSDDVGDGKKGKKKQKEATKAKKKKKAKVPDHQRITDRDVIPKLWDADRAMKTDGSYTFKIASWNVAGLRALMRNHPTALSDLVTRHNLDVLCLQETKLQESHLDDPKLKIRGHLLEDEGYEGHYSCATAKKGYSGTAVFVRRRKVGSAPQDDAEGTEGGGAAKNIERGSKKQAKLGAFFRSTSTAGEEKGGDDEKKQEDNNEEDSESAPSVKACAALPPTGRIDMKNLIPQNVTCQVGKNKHDMEGRIITLDFPLFSISNVYVPNSGQKLDRLKYRTDEWDVDLLQFLKSKHEDDGRKKIKGQQRQRPVIWLGDLNVAHLSPDVWNDGAKHLAKSAGTTPEERASFGKMLEDGDLVDSFRYLHPNAKGHYSYWSQRAKNREPNKGLRLDYFVCTRDLFVPGGGGDDVAGAGVDDDRKAIVRDCYMLPDQMGSDHCPIVLEVEIRE